MGKLIKELNEVLIIVNIKESNLEIFQDLLKKEFISMNLHNLKKSLN